MPPEREPCCSCRPKIPSKKRVRLKISPVTLSFPQIPISAINILIVCFSKNQSSSLLISLFSGFFESSDSKEAFSSDNGLLKAARRSRLLSKWV